MANASVAFDAPQWSDLPPLPSYTLSPVPAYFSWISDPNACLIFPIIAYWAISAVFHIIDTFDLFPQYRLHTPAEILQRNHVTRYECLRDTILQHVIQIISGYLLSLTEAEEMGGREEYDIARWATRLRLAQRAVPQLLALVGLNAAAISKNMSVDHPMIAGMLSGGRYPGLVTSLDGNTGESVPAFASWELTVAKAIYWWGVPILQFAVSTMILDTWQYFLHRAMHMNKWLYTTLHSRHHRLYVPYAYGALYNHPVEGFLLDTLGSIIAFKATGMSVRQATWFFTASSLKTVDDHGGYAFPWDPIQKISSNNAAYHDIHHQSWGIKTNFSQPWFTIWDRILDTAYKGDKADVKTRYDKAKRAAQMKEDAKKVQL